MNSCSIENIKTIDNHSDNKLCLNLNPAETKNIEIIYEFENTLLSNNHNTLSNISFCISKDPID